MRAVGSTGEPFTALASMFEGLYQRALKPDAELLEALKQAGWDPDAPKERYPMSVWVACLDASAAHLHPGVPRYDAWRLLGRVFIEGYFQTLVGRIILAVLPLMKPERFVDRVPNFVRTGLEEVVSEVDWVGPRHAVVTMHGPHAGASHVMAGVMEVCMERLGVRATLTPEPLAGVESRFTVKWE